MTGSLVDIEYQNKSGSIGVMQAKNAIILHGSTDEEEYFSIKYPSMSNSHWLPWLQKQLLVKGISTATPEIPNPYRLNWEVWRREFERFDITTETILVGHSCGGGFLVRWLSEHKDRKVGKVVLVAPWIDPTNMKKGQDDFFNFDIDPDLVSRTDGVTIFNSDDDMHVIQESVKILRKEIKNIGYKEFKGYRHFITKHMGTDAFPELLEEITK